jgi:hypothetical protein
MLRESLHAMRARNLDNDTSSIPYTNLRSSISRFNIARALLQQARSGDRTEDTPNLSISFLLRLNCSPKRGRNVYVVIIVNTSVNTIANTYDA